MLPYIIMDLPIFGIDKEAEDEPTTEEEILGLNQNWIELQST